MDERGRDVGGIKAFLQEPFDEVILFFVFADGQRGAQLFKKQARADFVDLIHGRNLSALNPHVGVALDVADLKQLPARHERDGSTGAAGAARPPDAMDVILAVIGQVIVEHDLDVVHVNAARGDVGGDQEFQAGLAEFIHYPVALHLRHIAVQAVGHVALGLQMIHQLIHHPLGVAENDAQLQVVDVDQAREQIHLEAAVHLVINLLDGRDGHRLLLDFYVLRVAGILFDEVADGPRHGGRKENGLPLLGRILQDGFNILAKTHVQHHVRLVENHHLERVEADGSPPHVIHHPARGADDDLGALLESPELALVRLPAVDREGDDAALEQGELVDLLRHLDGEFARRAEDEDLDRLQGGVGLLDGRNGEGRRLPGACLGLAHDVAPAQENGDGFGLDGGGLFKAEFFNGFEDFGGKSEFGK